MKTRLSLVAVSLSAAALLTGCSNDSGSAHKSSQPTVTRSDDGGSNQSSQSASQSESSSSDDAADSGDSSASDASDTHETKAPSFEKSAPAQVKGETKQSSKATSADDVMRDFMVISSTTPDASKDTMYSAYGRAINLTTGVLEAQIEHDGNMTNFSTDEWAAARKHHARASVEFKATDSGSKEAKCFHMTRYWKGSDGWTAQTVPTTTCLQATKVGNDYKVKSATTMWSTD